MNEFNNNTLPAIRGHRIARMTEHRLGNFQLCADTTSELVRENIGVMIGGCRDREWLCDRFQALSKSEQGRDYVVILSTNDLTRYWYRRSEVYQHTDDFRTPPFWQEGALTYTTPEKLGELSRSEYCPRKPVSLLIVDPYGIMPFAFGGGAYNTYSRPEQVVKFQNACSQYGHRPPILYFTPKPAKSMNTNAMLAHLAQESWWFVDGRDVRIGPPPKHRSTRLTTDLICI